MDAFLRQKCDSIEELRRLLEDSPFESWYRIERTLFVMFQMQFTEIEADVFEILSAQWAKFDKWSLWNFPKFKSYKFWNSKSIKVNLDPLARLIIGFSCIDNIDECT